ncbi:MAG: DUF202 domain-containing protein [Myxococcales bacterium]|nr:DUF202 domain-containing protein [Myxococcales bacterium]MCB9628017.1 DUF202 domain-containing protein [Sandaracinaceae bacterium]
MVQRYLNIPVTDALAAERTQLAAERTFLAYVRSAFAFFVAGVSGSQLLDAAWLVAIAYVLAGSSILVLAFGFHRLHASRTVVRDLVARIERERGVA